MYATRGINISYDACSKPAYPFSSSTVGDIIKWVDKLRPNFKPDITEYMHKSHALVKISLYLTYLEDTKPRKQN